MRNSSSKSHNSAFSKETKKSNLPLLKVQKVEKILDNKAEKYRNILTKLLKTRLLSALKLTKVADNKARFNLKEF